jgi:N-acetylneuraminic acid mutarotase
MSTRLRALVVALPLAVNVTCAGSGTAPTLPSDTTGTTWQRMSTFGGRAVRGAAAFAVGTNAYVVSGHAEAAGSGVVSEVWQYDAAEDAWTRRADFPGTPRLDACGFAIGARGYIALGSDNAVGELDDLWEYDPVTDTWSRKQDFPGGPRLLAVALVIQGKAYIISGGGVGGGTKDVWEYDPQTDAWTKKADFPGVARMAASGFAVRDRGYFGLGSTGGSYSRDFWEYDPVADRWTRKADFPGVGRGRAVGLSVGERGFISQGLLAGSGGSLTLTSDTWEYDLRGDSWIGAAAFPGSPRAMAVGFVVGPSLYLGLGNDALVRNLADLWRLTP